MLFFIIAVIAASTTTIILEDGQKITGPLMLDVSQADSSTEWLVTCTPSQISKRCKVTYSDRTRAMIVLSGHYARQITLNNLEISQENGLTGGDPLVRLVDIPRVIVENVVFSDIHRPYSMEGGAVSIRSIPRVSGSLPTYISMNNVEFRNTSSSVEGGGAWISSDAMDMALIHVNTYGKESSIYIDTCCRRILTMMNCAFEAPLHVFQFNAASTACFMANATGTIQGLEGCREPTLKRGGEGSGRGAETTGTSAGEIRSGGSGGSGGEGRIQK